MTTPTLLDFVRISIERTPAAPALLVEGQIVNYRHFYALTCVATRELRARGIGPGETVAISMAQGPIALVVLLALAQLGAVSVSMVPSLGPTRAELCRRHGVRRMVVSDAAAGIDGVEAIVMDRINAQGNETMRGLDGFGVRPDTPMRIALTSGTTGVPKGIVQTHEYLARRLHHSYWNTSSAARVMPPNVHYTTSLMLCLSTLRDGGLLVFPKGGYDNFTMLVTVQLHGVTHAALTPATLGAMVALLPIESPAFPSLTHLRIMGATPSTGLLDRVRRRISPNVYLPYAMNELGVVSMATPETLAREPRSCGYVVANACLEVVDETGRKVPAGVSGELRMAVDGMPQGYHGEGESAGSRFRDGWFYPGDRGNLRHDGLLFVEGRIDDIVNVGGHKVAPTHVEAILEAHESVQEAAVFAVDPEGEPRLEAAIVARGAVDAESLGAHAQQRLGTVLSPIRYHVVASLPRNEAGKIRRGELVAWVATQNTAPR